jgi:hypothetical protein
LGKARRGAGHAAPRASESGVRPGAGFIFAPGQPAPRGPRGCESGCVSVWSSVHHPGPPSPSPRFIICAPAGATGASSPAQLEGRPSRSAGKHPGPQKENGRPGYTNRGRNPARRSPFAGLAGRPERPSLRRLPPRPGERQPGCAGAPSRRCASRALAPRLSDDPSSPGRMCGPTAAGHGRRGAGNCQSGARRLGGSGGGARRPHAAGRALWHGGPLRH